MSDPSGIRPWLLLGLIPELKPRSWLKLLLAFGTPDYILRAPVSQLSLHIASHIAQAVHAGPAIALLDQTLAWLALPGNDILTLADEDYPAPLLELSDPPPLLYLKGRRELLGGPMLGVVGSRHGTPGGLDNARRFSTTLSQAGRTIVSGLALGIDTAAHEGGLGGRASTIAIVGTGLDRIYPARNHQLAHRLADEGLILSEFPLGSPPLAAHFPQRNRLIAGMGLGCLVVEAALRSGSLITARLAAEAGRDVFAIPGSIHSTLSKGCHALLKQGARLVESADDILEELQWQTRPAARPASLDQRHPEYPDETSHVLAQLGFDPVDTDTLCQRSGLTPDKVCAILLVLELDGRVASLPGSRYQRLQ